MHAATDSAATGSAPASHPRHALLPSRDPPSDEIEIGELLQALWRRKLLIVSVVFLLTLLAVLIVFQITPRYTADTKVLIGAPESKVVDIEAVLSGMGSDQAAVESEVQVLRSRSLAARVLDKLDLDERPEFNGNLRPPSIWSVLNPIDYVPEEWRAALLGSEVDEAPLTQDDIEARMRADVISTLQDAVSVRIEGRSRVIAVSATSEDPKLAAAIANTLSDLYLVEQLEAKFEATRRATSWLNERVAELRQQVEASERAVAEYRRTYGLTEAKESTVSGQQLSEINTQLILARTKTAEANARLRQVQSLVKSAGGVESAAEVLASPLIQKLREQEADVARRAAEMATEFGKRHPKMINIRAELKDLRGKIEGEVQKVVRGLRNELDVARTRERTLDRSFRKLKEENEEVESTQGQLRVLEREAAANRALFDTFLSRLKETGNQDDIQAPDARLISSADVPTSPSQPKKKLIVGAALAFSIVLGVLLAFLVEHLDRGFRSADQVEAMTGASTLTLVPLLSGIRRKLASPANYIISKPASSFAESLRTLHTGILLSNVDDTPKTVLVTSSLPAEGKTTISVSMARLEARSGRKVLLIDADLRRNRVAQSLGLSGKRGLVDVLAEKATTLEDVILTDEVSGLHVLPAGSHAPNPPELLGSNHMRSLLQALERVYDLIIIDSPPVLVVSDARILARLADTTVFVVRWAETKRELATHALRQVADSGAHIAGVVLSMVNIRKNAQYGYSDSSYYYGAARSYYAD